MYIIKSYKYFSSHAGHRLFQMKPVLCYAMPDDGASLTLRILKNLANLLMALPRLLSTISVHLCSRNTSDKIILFSEYGHTDLSCN